MEETMCELLMVSNRLSYSSLIRFSIITKMIGLVWYQSYLAAQHASLKKLNTFGPKPQHISLGIGWGHWTKFYFSAKLLGSLTFDLIRIGYCPSIRPKLYRPKSRENLTKVGCVYLMVVVSILPRAAFGRNHYRKTQPTLVFSQRKPILTQ